METVFTLRDLFYFSALIVSIVGVYWKLNIDVNNNSKDIKSNKKESDYKHEQNNMEIASIKLDLKESKMNIYQKMDEHYRQLLDKIDKLQELIIDKLK